MMIVISPSEAMTIIKTNLERKIRINIRMPSFLSNYGLSQSESSR